MGKMTLLSYSLRFTGREYIFHEQNTEAEVLEEDEGLVSNNSEKI